MTPEAQTTKGKLDKLCFIKMKNVCASEDTIERKRVQTIRDSHVSESPVSDRSEGRLLWQEYWSGLSFPSRPDAKERQHRGSETGPGVLHTLRVFAGRIRRGEDSVKEPLFLWRKLWSAAVHSAASGSD